MIDSIAAVTALALAVVPLSLGAETTTATGNALAENDRIYFEKMAQANLAEIAAGSLAQENARTDAVREYGERMIDDHKDLLSKQQALAQKHELEVPDRLGEQHAAAIIKLKEQPPERFDRAFMAQMAKDHEKTLGLVQETAANAENEALKTLAQDAEPIVEQHLELAKQMLKQLPDGAGAATQAD